MRFFLLILKNLKRNPMRTLLTTFAVIALVAIFSIILNLVLFFDDFMTEKNKDIKIMISERYRLMTLFNRSYVDQMIQPSSKLNQELSTIHGFNPAKHTVWHFLVFTLDKDMKDKNQQFFVLATLPKKIPTMLEGLEDIDPKWVDLMEKPEGFRPEQGVVMGGTVMKRLKKRVGDVFTAKSITHRRGDAIGAPIEMEFKIVAAIPEDNRWNDATLMDYAYLDRVLRAEKSPYDGKVNYAFLEAVDQDAAAQTGAKVEGYFPDLRAETSASAYSRFMEPLKNILWWIKWVLVPAILVIMTLILANTFSITVRERITEVAVLKVLGFRSGQILLLVLGEAALVGVLAGLAGAAFTFGMVNIFMGGIHIPELPILKIPLVIFWWGPLIGFLAALAGGLVPALGARSVKVAEAFAGVA